MVRRASAHHVVKLMAVSGCGKLRWLGRGSVLPRLALFPLRATLGVPCWTHSKTSGLPDASCPGQARTRATQRQWYGLHLGRRWSRGAFADSSCYTFFSTLSQRVAMGASPHGASRSRPPGGSTLGQCGNRGPEGGAGGKSRHHLDSEGVRETSRGWRSEAETQQVLSIFRK